MKLECKNCGIRSRDIPLNEGCCTEWRCGQCMVKQTYCTMIDPVPYKTVIFKPDFELSEDKNDSKEKDGRGDSVSGEEDSGD